MRHKIPDLLVVIFILIIAGALHRLTTWETIVIVPFIMVSSSLITWTVPQPLRFLLPLAFIVELTSVKVFGLLGLVTIIPWLLWLARGRVERDLSFSYLGLLLLTSTAQLAVLVLTELFEIGFAASPIELSAHLARWFMPGVIILATGLVVIFFALLAHRLSPVRQEAIVSLESKRYPTLY